MVTVSRFDSYRVPSLREIIMITIEYSVSDHGGVHVVVCKDKLQADEKINALLAYHMIIRRVYGGR
jgi:hypothetical protein